MSRLRKGATKSSGTESAPQGFFDFLGVDRNADENVLSESTYFACMKVLSEAVGKLPLKLLLYNQKNGVETARKHQLQIPS